MQIEKKRPKSSSEQSQEHKRRAETKKNRIWTMGIHEINKIATNKNRRISTHIYGYTSVSR